MPNFRSLLLPSVCSAALLLLAACNGQDTPATVAAAQTAPPATGGTTDNSSCQAQPMRVPTQRVSPAQYSQMVQEVFGTSVAAVSLFPQATTGAVYSTSPDANVVGTSAATAIADAADAVADQITPLLPVCNSGIETDCARAALTGYATKAFRRPAETAEIDRLMTVFTAARTDLAYSESLATAVSSMLQMPQTLYLVEPSLAGARLTLNDREIAQRLAFFFRGGLPDAALTTSADAAALSSADARRTQALRLLATPQGKQAVARFVREWLLFDRANLPVFTTDVRAALEEELLRLVSNAMAQPNGLKELLTSRRGYVNATLEQFYGLPTSAKDTDGWRAIDFAPGRRAGILTHPLLMAMTAHDVTPSVVLRGKFVRVMLMCEAMPPPPPGVTSQQPDLGPNATQREMSNARLALPACQGCHTQMDPIGYGLLGFDGKGQVRQGESTQGEIRGTSAVAGTFNTVDELAAKLASSDQVADCFSRQWLRYSFGKTTDADADVCTVKQLSTQFISSGRNLPALFAGTAGLDAFVTRAGVAP